MEIQEYLNICDIFPSDLLTEGMPYFDFELYWKEADTGSLPNYTTKVHLDVGNIWLVSSSVYRSICKYRYFH